jgi:hypothetical protein
VILFPGATQWALEEFDNEKWVDALAFQSGNNVSEEATVWLSLGPPTQFWKLKPLRPVLNLLPATEAGLTASGERISTAHAVDAATRSLFVAPPAGIWHQTRAIAEWDPTVDTNTVAITGEEMMEWQKSLHLKGAVRLRQVRDLVLESGFDDLYPAPSLLVPGSQLAALPTMALASPQRDRALILVPEGGAAIIPVRALWPGLEGSWFSLRDGSRSPAEVQESETSVRYAAPGAGDWLLQLSPP